MYTPYDASFSDIYSIDAVIVLFFEDKRVVIQADKEIRREQNGLSDEKNGKVPCTVSLCQDSDSLHQHEGKQNGKSLKYLDSSTKTLIFLRQTFSSQNFHRLPSQLVFSDFIY